MPSDIDYHSSQDDWQIEYQIDLFEIRQLCKSRKQNRQKSNKSSYPISKKTLKLNPEFVKVRCIREKKTVKAQAKPFRYNRSHKIESSKLFECDEELQTESTENSNSEPSTDSKSLKEKSQENFSAFRRHFYRIHQQHIKSTLQEQPNTKIIDIRPAPVDPLVQSQFMKSLNNNSYGPRLAYHGTKLANINSILRYGFLVPNQIHPKNKDAPIIQSINGQAHGKGIYCSTTVGYSMSYMQTTNTLLVCAILPSRDVTGKIRSVYGNIIVLRKVDQIIPLFLVDIRYTDQRINQPVYTYAMEKESIEKEQKQLVTRISMGISRQYLRKILALINDDKRKNNLYQVRRFE